MKHRTKALLALALTVAMVCAMVTPAFAWVSSYSRLRSPNGVYWFDTQQMRRSWLHSTTDDASTTIYSQDMTVWYTLAGMSYYLNIAVMPGDDWISISLPEDYISPDGGKMWLAYPLVGQWLDWLNLWPDPTDPNMPSLYKDPDSYVMRTAQTGDAVLTDIDQFNMYNEMTPSTTVQFYAQTEFRNVMMSVFGETGYSTHYKADLTTEDWYACDPNSNYFGNDGTITPPLLYPTVSCNPYYLNAGPLHFYSPEYDGDTFVVNDMPSAPDQYQKRFIRLWALEDGAISVDLHCSGPSWAYCAVDLNALPYDSLQKIEANNSVILPGPLSQPYGTIVLNDFGRNYQPLVVQSGTTIVIDENQNGIIDTQDNFGDPTILDPNPVQPMQTVRLTLNVQANQYYTLPVYVWGEGQVADAYNTENMNATLSMIVRRASAETEREIYPIIYKYVEDGVAITYVYPDYAWNASYYTCDPAISGLSFDSQTLTLPETIGGSAVTEITDGALRDFFFIEHCRKCILPNTVKRLGEAVFGYYLERVHIPCEAQVTRSTFLGLPDRMLQICCDVPNSLAQQALTINGSTGNFQFLVCTEHGVSHTEHFYGEWTEATEATCTSAGEKTRTCTMCGDTQTETIPALGHDFTNYVSNNDAGCTTDGTMTGSCERCGVTDTITEEGSALGHSFSICTCIDANEHERRCDRCDAQETQPHYYDAAVVPATCTNGGYTIYVCSYCGYSYTGNETPVLGHSFLNYVSDNNATCTADGTMTAMCERCDATDTIPEEGSALGHSFTNYNIDDGTATCTEDGTKTAKCDRCDETDTIPDEGSALGHDMGEWVVTREPTTTQEGEETRACSRCDYTESRPIDRLPVTGIFRVEAGRAKPGKRVQVTVSTQDNPGIVATMLHLSYDPQVLTLTAVNNGEVFADTYFTPGGDLAEIPFSMHWTDSVGENHTLDGTLVTFTFLVADDAQPGETTVTVTYDANSTFDRSMHDVPFVVENDGVEVCERMAGDSDGDGELSLKDVVALSRFLAGGWDVEIDPENADVDGDGELTLRDIVLMERYLAGGWGVVLV